MAEGSVRKDRQRERWDRERVRALRRYLGLSQQDLADELGVRQQTVSEWETGVYEPRGASSRLLTMVAERTAFAYRTGETATGDGEDSRPKPTGD